MKLKSESQVAQSCPTLRDPMHCSLLGSSTHGIFQARVLEWGVIAFSGQASLSITNSQSLLKLMSMASVMPSNRLILCCPFSSCPQSFPASGSFPMSQRRKWQPTPVLLPGKPHGWRSPVGCSPWGLEESDMTERLHFHFSLSCIGEGNGNPLQCSCLEIPGTVEPGGLPSMGSHRVGHD